MNRHAAWITVFLSWLVSFAPAQDPSGEGGQRSQDIQQGQQPPGRKPVPGSQPGTQTPDEAGEVVTAEGEAAAEADGTISTVHAIPVDQRVTLSGWTDPKRLAPGESGMAYVQVDVRDSSVVLAGPPLALNYARNQGLVTLGEYSLDPPRRRQKPNPKVTVAGYDDTFLIKVPVSVSPAALHGKVPVSCTLTFLVADGTTGSTTGENKRDVRFDLVVGPSKPRPAPLRIPGSQPPPVTVAGNGGGAVPPEDEDAEEEGEGLRGFRLQVAIDPAELVRGGSGTVIATLVVPAGFYAQTDHVQASLEPIDGIVARAAILPDGEPKPGPTGDLEVYQERAAIRLPVRVTSDAADGARRARVSVTYQACDEATGLCYPDATLSKDVSFLVRAGTDADVAVPVPDDVPLPDDGTETRDLRTVGWLYYLGLVFGGLLLAFTPCVYPMIPITISVFGASKSNSVATNFALGGAYALTIAGVYGALGAAAGIGGKAFGAQMSNPIVVAGLALVFVAMAASMFGAFEIKVPDFASSSFFRSGSGILKPVLMGLVGGIVIAPCAGPAVAAVLADVAKTASWRHGFLAMFMLGFGIGIPFLLLAAFAGSLAGKMPRAGGWMTAIKNLFGFALLGFAIYYLRTVLPSEVTWILWSLLSVAFLVFWGGIFTGAPTWRVVAGVLIAGLTAWVFVAQPVLESRDGPAKYLQPQEGFDLIRKAKAEGRPVFIDLWAEWCPNCKKISKNVLPRPEVQAALEPFQVVIIDAGKDTEKVFADLAELLPGVEGLPVALPRLFAYSGDGALSWTAAGYKESESFADFAARLVRVLAEAARS